MTKDVRISVGLPLHPKTKKLIRRTGTDGAWRLVCLLAWVAGNRPDGDLSGLSDEDIELCVDWPGVEGVFVGSLLSVGFLDGEQGSYRMHDWQEHNPWASGSDARSDKAKWLALIKHHGREEASRMMPEYAAKLSGSAAASKPFATSMLHPATSMQVAETSMQDHAVRCAPSPSPSPSPNTTPAQPASASVQARGREKAAVAACRFDAAEFLSGHGVERQTADDYLTLRKSKKAASTLTALRPVVAEAEKAGMSVQSVIELCCVRGWVGFKAEWAGGQKARDGPPWPAKFDPVAHINRNRTRPSEAQNVIDITGERLA